MPTQLDFSSLVVGIVVGTVPLLVWEGFIKPRRERRALATVIADEIAHNVRLVVRFQQTSVDATGIRKHPIFSCIVFDALVGRMGELPAYDVGAVIGIYRRFKLANQMTSHGGNPIFASAIETATLDGQGIAHDRSTSPELLISIGYDVLDALGKSGAPGWTRRRELQGHLSPQPLSPNTTI